MNFDISQILEHWDYEPGQVVVRKFKARDGSEKIQLRVDLGLLQMNAEGRPDGKRPFGHESLLDHYTCQVEKFRAAHGGSDEGYQLKAEDCAKLQQEAIQYHHRYICSFQLGDFESVIRDTERNISAFNFVRRYATDDLSWPLQQFRPQVLMMKTRAKGAIALREESFDEAIRLIEGGVAELQEFYREFGRYDLMDQSGEIQSLEAWMKEVQSRRPLSERELLESALDEAIRNEDFEKAAQVRDALRKMKTS